MSRTDESTMRSATARHADAASVLACARPRMARVLVLGSSGMLGRAIISALRNGGVSMVAPSRRDLDLGGISAIRKVDLAGCDTIINCAAWTRVDDAEADEAGATAVNGTGVGRLADAAAQAGSLLVHFSTDYVFDGSSRVPYTTRHPRCPANAYGRSKARGEELLECSGADHLIVRTSWLYAPWGQNFVRTIAGLARMRPLLRVVNDQRGRPTSAEHLAAATLRLLGAGARGIAHVTDGGECTWFDLAREVVATLGLPARVEPCTTAEFPRPAPRPAYSVLDITETESLIGPLADWRENVRSVAARIES